MKKIQYGISIGLILGFTAAVPAFADDPIPPGTDVVGSSVPVKHPRAVDADPDAHSADLKGNIAMPFLQLTMPSFSGAPKDKLLVAPAGAAEAKLTLATTANSGSSSALAVGLDKNDLIIDTTSGSISAARLALMIQMGLKTNPDAGGQVGFTGKFGQDMGGFIGNRGAANGYMTVGYDLQGNLGGPIHDSAGSIGMQLEGGYLALGGKDVAFTIGPIVKFIIQGQQEQKEQAASLPTGLKTQFVINQRLNIGATVTQELLAARKRNDADVSDKYLDASAYVTLEIPLGELPPLYLGAEGTARAVSTKMLAASPQDFSAPFSGHTVMVSAAIPIPN